MPSPAVTRDLHAIRSQLEGEFCRWNSSAGTLMPVNPSVPSSGHELRSELQVILDAVVEGVCGLDAQGNVTFCNHAMLNMLGYRTEEMVGKNIHALLHHGRPDGSSDSADDCAFRKAMDANQPTHVTGELFWRKDGSCFPTEYWVLPLQQPGQQQVHRVHRPWVVDVVARDQRGVERPGA